MTRGRLIWPMLVEIERIDTNETRLADGYDDIYQEPVIVPATQTIPGIPNVGAPRGTIATQYQDPIQLHAQVETADWNVLRMFANGDAPRAEVTLVYHYRELESRSLIDPTGAPMLRKGDRLRRILHARTLEAVVEIPATPGLYAIRVDDSSFGLSGGTRNLLIVTYQDREQGVEA